MCGALSDPHPPRSEAKAFAKDDKMFVKRANTRTKLETYLYQLLQEAERVEARENIRKALEVRSVRSVPRCAQFVVVPIMAEYCKRCYGALRSL